MKKISCNLKIANSKLILCIATLFMMLSFAMKVGCADGSAKSVITLPKAENGIAKIEYLVNGEPKGSTDGVDSVELEHGAKINFAVKFESEGYGKLHVRNVRINSENGSVLRLNTYAKDDEGNFVLMRVQDSELINPEQTYVSSNYIVRGDDKLSFEGVEEDKYSVKISDENDDVNLFDAVKLKYSENGGNYVDAEFSENENAFFINGLTKSSNVKLMFEIKEGYTDSNLSLVNNEHQIAIDQKSKICTLPELKDDAHLEIRNFEKNKYNITFGEYTNAGFSYRIAGSEDEFKSSENLTVSHGDSLEIKCETSEDGILQSGAVTANGKVITAKDGVYTLENIKQHYSIAITPKANALYTISLPANEDRIKLCDTFGNEIHEIDAKQNSSVDFKIIPSDAYEKNFILSEMYAVPISKLSNGTYDVTANPEGAASFLILPMGNYLYSVKNISEPVKIIATKMEKSTYTVTLPETIIGADAEVELNENVTKITENKFKVVHGSDFVVNLEARPGYDLSTINAADVDNSVEIKKDGNKYTFKNIDSDKHLIINGASTASCKVSFDGKDVVATNENGSAWENNTASVKYQEGALRFKVRPAEETGDENENISLSIKSGNGKLEKISSEKNAYLLSGVTGDIVLSAHRTHDSNVTITLKSDDEDIQFTDANDESIVLPEENTVKYGTDLNFKVLSKSGKSTDNVSVSSEVTNPITESGTSSNTYSVTALRSGAMLASTETITYNITFGESESAIYTNSKGEVSHSDSAEEGSGLTFYTEAKEGYEYADNLDIQIFGGYSHRVYNIMKIIVGDGSEPNYDGEWIKLSTSGKNDLYIQATKEPSGVRYEIAGNTDTINEYIEFDKENTDSDGNVISYKYTKTRPLSPITPDGITDDLKITSIRNLRRVSATFSYAAGIEYKTDTDEPIGNETITMNYGEALVFKISAKPGYDTSDIQVMASTATGINILPLTNGIYIIMSVKEDTTVTVSGVKKTNVSLSFEQYEGVNYKNISGAEYVVHQQVPYGEEIIFQIEISEGYSQSADKIKVKVIGGGNEEISGKDDGREFEPDKPDDYKGPHKKGSLYVIPEEYVTGDMKITIEGLEANQYSVGLRPAEGIKYVEATEKTPLPLFPELNGGIIYGNPFKFRIIAEDGYDISNLEVIAKSNSGDSSPVTLIPANGIYTIENITSDYTVTVSGAVKQQHTVEIRTVSGVSCLDAYGKTLPSSVTVSYGDSLSFYLSFDSAYSRSKDTADVTIKGSNNKVPHDANGKYTLSNITEDKIIEIINIKKNTYTATFIPAEGVIYRTAKGKEFSGKLDVEYGESLYFKLSLLDAYDQSIPSVKANGKVNLLENGGTYVLNKVDDDVTITVENVVKNPEELTIEDIQNVPNPVTNEHDVNAVVAATKAYNSLSDEEKKLVTNKAALEKAQNESADINHNSNGVSVSGVDWNIKLIVTPLSDDEKEMKAFSEKVDRRDALSLYRVELIDLLTGESYEIADNSDVQLTMPCPDLTGYKNVTVAHENLAGNMDYIDPNIVAGTVRFSAPSVGLFGVAAKAIPNYSKDTSNMSISMGSLVSDDDELKTLLGENLSSQLGHLIDKGETDNKENASNGLDSIANGMASGTSSFIKSLYDWALDNEFLAVVAILVLGSLLILLILLINRKKDKENKKDHLQKKS